MSNQLEILQHALKLEQQTLATFRDILRLKPIFSAQFSALVDHHDRRVKQLQHLLAASPDQPPLAPPAGITLHAVSPPVEARFDIISVLEEPGGTRGGTSSLLRRISPADGQAQLIAARMLTPTVRELTLQFNRPITFRPGQYITLEAEIGGQFEKRPYSIARASLDRISIWVKRVIGGRFSTYVHGLELNQAITSSGLKGDFILGPAMDSIHSIVFIATGTGLAPLYAMLCEVLATRSDIRRIDLLWGLRSPADAFFTEELQRLAQSDPRFRYRLVYSESVSGRSLATTHPIPEILQRVPPRVLGSTAFYLAGNGMMVREAMRILGEKGVDAALRHTEAFF